MAENRDNRAVLLSMILPLLICSVLGSEVKAAGAESCPLIVGVASTAGRPDVFKSYIGGEWRTSASGKTLKVLSPVNETTLFEVQARAVLRLPVFLCAPGSADGTGLPGGQHVALTRFFCWRAHRHARRAR
jgi:hypothetical protein